MATKRIIQLPTLNNNNQITWGNSSQWGYLRKLPNELPWWDWPNPKNVIQTPTTDANGNITGWWWKKTAMNSPEEPEVWTYRGNNGVVQTINKNTTPANWWFTQYSSKTDRSAAVMNANKNGTTSSLPQATPANLPWVTKYAGIDKNYWNNQAGIDLVNKQSELDALSEAEKAQRLAGAYNPTPPPTVATAQNPVIKKTIDKPQEQTVTPAAIQGADINTLNSTLDELKYKVNVEWKQLTKEEYMTFESARRQLQEMMKPKEYTWFENVIKDTKNLIETTKKEESASNEKELARYTESQEKRKESQLAILSEQEMTSKKRLASILWWSGQWQSTDTVEQFKALEDSFALRKQEKINEMQDRIDLYGATLRKDSKETIQALEKRLADQQLKVVDIDLKNLDMINDYNQKQWLSQLEKIDKLQQMADDIIANNTPLTDQQKADAAMRSNKIIKPDWTFDRELWEILKKQNPMIAAEAVRQSTAIQNERIQSELAMRWLDADIKRAQLNKLLNPEKPDETFTYTDNGDWTFTAKGNRWTLKTVDSSWWVVTGTTKSWVPISQAIQTALDKCKNWAQCGKFVNDVLETVGYGRMIWDSYTSKVQTINKIGVANTIDDIATWSIFAYPVKNSSYWHIGIVTWKNADWTINIMDYNYKGDEQQRERMNVKPSEIFNMKWLISKPIVVDSTVYQKQSAGKGLSAVAKEAVKSWQINWTPTVQSGIIEELAKAGEFDKWQGNSTFYTSKPAVKDEIANFTEWYAKRQQAKQIFDKLKADWTLWWATGRFDTLANKWKRFAGAWSTDVNNLNQILSESLSKYMNKISGATVSEAEVERLREQIPNLSMWDKQFIDAFEQYDQSMQRWLDNTLTKYWFNSYDDIKQKIYWSNKSAQPASTSWQISSDRK